MGLRKSPVPITPGLPQADTEDLRLPRIRTRNLSMGLLWRCAQNLGVTFETIRYI